jgi:hypothetical protein
MLAQWIKHRYGEQWSNSRSMSYASQNPIAGEQIAVFV